MRQLCNSRLIRGPLTEVADWNWNGVLKWTSSRHYLVSVVIFERSCSINNQVLKLTKLRTLRHHNETWLFSKSISLIRNFYEHLFLARVPANRDSEGPRKKCNIHNIKKILSLYLTKKDWFRIRKFFFIKWQIYNIVTKDNWCIAAKTT